MGPIGNLTKQLAQQAIGNQVKEVVDSLRPGESPQEPKSTPDLTGAILGQLQAMQKALKEDEELVVTCTAGSDTVRILDVFVPSPGVVVLTGVDAANATTRVITPVQQLQLVCKPRNVSPPAKPVRIRFIAPRPKE